MTDKRIDRAFTLAEVLITLGIIGVVAALTIPSIMISAQKNAYVSGAIKYQSIFQSAIKQYMADNNYDNLIQSDIFNNGGWSQAGTQRAWNALKGYFKILKDCDVNTNQGCFPNNTKQLNNNYPVSTDDKNPDSSIYLGKAILNDGVTIVFADDPNNCNNDRSISHTGEITTVCGVFRIDTNGMQGPNQYGRDEFLYWVLNNGKVLPIGTNDDYLKGCDPTSNDVTADSSGAPGFGLGCTYEVIMNKAMNY